MSARYMVLAGDNYYPSAWDDYQGSADELDYAKSIGMQSGKDWFEVFDQQALRVVCRATWREVGAYRDAQTGAPVPGKLQWDVNDSPDT